MHRDEAPYGLAIQVGTPPCAEGQLGKDQHCDDNQTHRCIDEERCRKIHARGRNQRGDCEQASADGHAASVGSEQPKECARGAKACDPSGSRTAQRNDPGDGDDQDGYSDRQPQRDVDIILDGRVRGPHCRHRLASARRARWLMRRPNRAESNG